MHITWSAPSHFLWGKWLWRTPSKVHRRSYPARFSKNFHLSMRIFGPSSCPNTEMWCERAEPSSFQLMKQKFGGSVEWLGRESAKDGENYTRVIHAEEPFKAKRRESTRKSSQTNGAGCRCANLGRGLNTPPRPIIQPGDWQQWQHKHN